MKIYLDAGGRLRVNNKYFDISNIVVATNDLSNEVRLYITTDDNPFLTIALTSITKSDGITNYTNFADFLSIFDTVIGETTKIVQKSIDYLHDKIHKGWVFYINRKLTLNNNQTLFIEFITPDLNLGEIHFGYDIVGTGKITFEIFEDSTRQLTVAGKTVLPIFNRKRSSANISSVTANLNSTIQAGVGADGTQIRDLTIGYSQGGTRITIPIGTSIETVFKPSTKYMMKITSGTDQDISYRLDWYNDID